MAKVNQRAIAKKLAVSLATVSRSLADHPSISLSTRERVQEAAVAMGYRFVSDAKPASDLLHVSLLVASVPLAGMHSLVLNRVLKGITSVARKQRVALHIDLIPMAEVAELKSPLHWPLALRDRVVSGVILFGGFPAEAIVGLAAAFPAVWMVERPGAVACDCIDHEDRAAASEHVHRLVELGHRRIGFAMGDPSRMADQNRLAGYADGLRKAGLNFDPTIVIAHAGTTGWPAFGDQVYDLWRQGVTAWVCVNDYVGYQVMGLLKDRAVAAPQQVSVCGFDNFDPPPGLEKLNSMDAPFEKMGAEAVRRLMQRLRDPRMDLVRISYEMNYVSGMSIGQPV